ncbi:dihydrofolate reductase family protein [Lentzea cavernae]|uniref:Dihydrofolate reductase n=1 Tax=Lentzea cavernae TaxID=2020703 RepID=A0ABQ3MUJ7_9PSEU|nr:dihydrofolate reductase family protein [Lentzea cavernae]GHH60242.1 dihydrofolate reductase [Lentzea cavernae]
MGNVRLHFSMSLDGFVASADNGFDWLSRTTDQPGLVSSYAERTGAILGGRKGWDAFPDPSAAYGGQFKGQLFVLTSHPEDATPAAGVTFLNCDVAEAARIGLEAADGKDLEVLSPTIGGQLLQRGLVDEIALHIAPVLLGHGLRFFGNPGGVPIHLHRLDTDDPHSEVDVRYRPVR